MKRFVALSILVSIGLWLTQPIDGLSQSGRRRPPTRTPRPTGPEKPTEEKPSESPAGKPTTPIPPGGEIDERKFDPEVATTRLRLKNGLTVIIREKYSKPLAAITTHIKAGHKDEPPEAAAVAELVQRLLLQGTSDRPGTQAARQLRTLGGVTSAWASSEKLIHQVVAPAENVEDALEIQADILLHPVFESDTVQRQAALLAQKYESRPPSLSAEVFASMLRLAFPDRSGRHLNPAAVRALTRDQVLRFYRAHYRPDNVILSIVGAVNPFTITEPIQRAYGGWTAQKIEEPEPQSQETPPPADQAPATGTQRPAPSDQLLFRQQVKEIDPALVTIGFRLTDVEKTDWTALDVLAAALGRGRASRLAQIQLAADSILLDFSLSQHRSEKTALWAFQLWVAPEKISQVESGFFELVQRLRREVLSPGEIQRARSLLERWYFERRADLRHEAEDLAWHQATSGDYHQADHYLEQLRAVTAERVQRVAARYLTLSRAMVHEVLPERVVVEGVTGESFSQWVSERAPGIDKPVSPSQVTQAEPVPLYEHGQRPRPGKETDVVLFSLQPEPVRNYSVHRGPRAYVREDRSLPLVSVGLIFLGGRLFEEANNSGITEAMLRAMMRGAAARWHPETGKELERGQEMTLSASAMAMKLEQLGADLEVVNEPDFFGFILNVLSRNQEQALKLLVNIVERPTFPEDQCELVRREMLFEQRQEGVRPVELAWQALAPRAPYRWPRLGTPEALQRLEPDHLRAWYGRSIGRQFPLVLVVGDTDGSLLISTIIAREIYRREVDESFRAAIPAPPDTPQERVESGQSASALAVGFLTSPARQDDGQVFEILEHALSGPGGRLADQWRDQSGLAYEARAVYDPRLLASAFFFDLRLAAENQARVWQALERELNRLASESLTDEEMALGVNAAIGSQRVRLQRHPARVLAYAQRVIFAGQPADVDAYGERLRAITKEKIQALAGQHFKWNQRGVGKIQR